MLENGGDDWTASSGTGSNSQHRTYMVGSDPSGTIQYRTRSVRSPQQHLPPGAQSQNDATSAVGGGTSRRQMQMEGAPSLDDQFEADASRPHRHAGGAPSRSDPAPPYASIAHRQHGSRSAGRDNTVESHHHQQQQQQHHRQQPQHHGTPDQQTGSGRNARSNPSGGQPRQQQQPMLEFESAMRDFQEMFPTIDGEIIEAVLRANDGAVEATIDHLCSMSTNSGSGGGVSSAGTGDATDGLDAGFSTAQSSSLFSQGQSPTMQHRRQQASSTTPATSETLEAATRARQELEEMLAEARQAERQALHASRSRRSSDIVMAPDLPSSATSDWETRSPSPPPLPPKDVRSRQLVPPAQTLEGREQSTSQVPHMRVATARTSTSGLVAPLVGPLPKDFLRLAEPDPTTSSTAVSSSRQSHHHHREDVRHLDGGTSRRHFNDTQQQQQQQRRSHRNSHAERRSSQHEHRPHHYNLAELLADDAQHQAPPPTMSSVTSSSSAAGRRRGSAERRTTTTTSSGSAASTAGGNMQSQSRNQASSAQRRSRSDSVRRGLLPAGTSPITHAGTAMTEDGVLLSLVTSTSQQQLQEDERIAMMLQNAEFLDELRHNRDFMSLLENEEAETEDTHILLAPSNTVSPHRRDSTRKPVPYMIRNDTSPDHQQQPTSSHSATTTPSPDNAGARVTPDESEDARPEQVPKERRRSRGNTLHRQATISAEKFRDRLLSGNMKESTRQLFLQLAKKFQRRQRHRMNLDEAVASSTAALLDDDSDDVEMAQRLDDDERARLEFMMAERDHTDDDHVAGGYWPGKYQAYKPGSNDKEQQQPPQALERPSYSRTNTGNVGQPGAFRHGNQLVTPDLVGRDDSELITFYAEEEDDLALGMGYPAATATTATSGGTSDPPFPSRGDSFA